MPTVDTMSRGPMGPPIQRSAAGLLIDTMQYEEGVRSQPVPNHLLETKIYSKISQNAVVMAKPSVIHFSGFEVEKKHTMSLSIVNVSTEVIRMHIIPPQTKYFYIKYTKSERLVPGLTLDCTIEFTPDEWRYFYDCIRINCPGEENLIIPIHAYPIMSTKEFPRLFNFPPVPVGHRMTKVFPLKCEAPVDFEYQLTYLQPHQAFTVFPMSGIIPANGETEVSVTFSPIEFHTAYMRIQLVISQFNSDPIVCTFTGTSTPGLLKEMSENRYTTEMIEEGLLPDSVLDPQIIKPVDRARSKKVKVKLPPPSNVKQEIEYQGLKFPADLDTPYAVSQVLNQEPGKLRAKDLREVVVKKGAKPKAEATRQMKEAKFEHQVRQNVYEERQNQLRWQSKLGDEQISTEDRAKILAERNRAWNIYKYKRRGEPVEEEEYNRECTQCTFKRTMRDKDNIPSETAQFDTYTNDMWSVRHGAINKFVQAARKIIIRQRATYKLKSLRKLVEDWRKKKYTSTSLTVEEKEKFEEENKFELIPTDLEFSSEKVKPHQFVTYVPPNIKDDMAPDALGSVPYKPTDVVVKRKVPYFGLKVPQQYKLSSYRPFVVQDAASGYVPVKQPKPLRTGAEDEVIMLPPPVVVKEKSSMTRTSLAIDLSKDTEPLAAPEPKKVQSVVQVAPVVPPPTLFQPMEYPSMHIFNPAPGLQVFQANTPYAETDPDFHLCPLPRYFRKDHAINMHASTQRKYMDREDVIRGIMMWKKFPSQGLTSLSNTPTLTNVWVPRWDDPFGSDILGQDTPLLMDSLSQEDKDNIEEEEEEGRTTARGGVALTPEMRRRGRQNNSSRGRGLDSRDEKKRKAEQQLEGAEEEEGRTTARGGVALTPEMVNAQFILIDPTTPTEEKVAPDAFPNGNKMPATNIPVSGHGPVAREKREEELEHFITKKYNRLGAKIQARVNSLNNLTTDKNLVLK